MYGTQLRIDAEFSALCPPLTNEERNLLESSLNAEGCHTPLVVWRGLLVDGHNRYEICKRFKIEFTTRELDAGERSEVVEWIIANQLGRRNLTDDQKSNLRGCRLRHESKKVGGQPGNKNTSRNDAETVAASNQARRTAERLASEYGVSERTIYNDANYAGAIETIAEHVGTEAKKKILSGESGLTKKQVIAIADLPPKQQSKAIQEAAKPRANAVKASIERAAKPSNAIARADKFLDGMFKQLKPAVARKVCLHIVDRCNSYLSLKD